MVLVFFPRLRAIQAGVPTMGFVGVQKSQQRGRNQRARQVDDVNELELHQILLRAWSFYLRNFVSDPATPDL